MKSANSLNEEDKLKLFSIVEDDPNVMYKLMVLGRIAGDDAAQKLHEANLPLIYAEGNQIVMENTHTKSIKIISNISSRPYFIQCKTLVH